MVTALQPNYLYYFYSRRKLSSSLLFHELVFFYLESSYGIKQKFAPKCQLVNLNRWTVPWPAEQLIVHRTDSSRTYAHLNSLCLQIFVFGSTVVLLNKSIWIVGFWVMTSCGLEGGYLVPLSSG
jgi:hypothetical protein